MADTPLTIEGWLDQKGHVDTVFYISLGSAAFSALAAIAVWLYLQRPLRPVVQRLTAADRAIIEGKPVKHDGMALHRKVPKSMWCVTKDDLEQFRRLVKNAVKEGRITPTDRDRFNPADDNVGPCVHTVNAQFIMPVTQAAGGPSWALMKHPEGLPCHVFVTHGWAEGIYEFLDKVLGSWPRGCSNAYCCMLSNPQNLDISKLCSSPADSPFAKALTDASHMIVIPNRACSIYTRVWCAYEAFLGYSGGKIIYTAATGGRRYWGKGLKAVFICFAGGALGLALASGVHLAGWTEATPLIQTYSVSGCFVFAAFFLRWKRRLLSKRLTVAKVLTLGHIGSYCVMVAYVVPVGQPGTIPLCVTMAVSMTVVPLAIESDLVMVEQSVQESVQLLNGFTGHLSDAQCTVPSDGESIRKEINESGSEQDVDDAVAVLIRMGTFTPRLRRTVERTGVLGNVSRHSRSVCVGLIAVWLVLPMEHFTLRFCELEWLSWLCWGELLVWLIIIPLLPPDCIAFGVGTLLLCAVFIAVATVEFASGLQEEGFCLREYALGCFVGPLIVILSLLGPALTAQIPLVGPPLVRLATCSRRSRSAGSGKTFLQAQAETTEEQKEDAAVAAGAI